MNSTVLVSVSELTAPLMRERNAENVDAFQDFAARSVIAGKANQIYVRAFLHQRIQSATRSRIVGIGRNT